MNPVTMNPKVLFRQYKRFVYQRPNQDKRGLKDAEDVSEKPIAENDHKNQT